MRVPFLAAVASAACLLSACGFVAPAPPMPPDDNRVAINHGDPRLVVDDRPAATAAEQPREDPVTVASAAPVSGILAGKSWTAPVSPPPPTTPAPAALVAPPADHSPVASSPSIPVPPAPAKAALPLLPVKAPAPAPASTPASASALTASLPASTPPAPVLVAAAASTAPTTVVQEVPPEAKPSESTPMAPAAPATASQAGPAAAGPIPVVDIAPESPQPAAQPVVPKEVWRITPEDGTVRQALVRWAAKANWTFGPDQWELPFDLPIQAPAEFEAASFQEATQALSQAIAMTESPIRPCFYGNHVLRMVSFNRSCNRAPAAQS